MRLPQIWRRWIVASMLLAFVAIQAIEATHHHRSAAATDACAICQVVAHTPLDFSPVALLAAATAVWFKRFYLARRMSSARSFEARYASYRSRAPPSRWF